MACNSNPFSPLQQNNLIPITILLPPYTIQLNPINGVAGSGSWTLPNNVRLVGTGLQTILLGGVVGGVSCCSGAMIEMGPPGPCPSAPYTGIAIEHLQLNTQGSYGGIENECAGPSSYVNDVKITGYAPTCVSAGTTCLNGNGLTIGPGATNSGPYTDIQVIAVPGKTCGPNPATHLNCVLVETQTQGIHGFTCLGNITTGASDAGILVNGSNNSIEDVHVESFYDGVGLGNTNSSAIGNILVSNIQGGDTANCTNGGVANAVHIYGSVTDAAILGVSSGPAPDDPNLRPSSIRDDETGTIIQGCKTSGCTNPITSGLYILGGPDGGNTGEYSRFSVNPANPTAYGDSNTVVPTWGAGNPTPGILGTTCYTPGALYSFTGAGAGNESVYVCTYASAGGETWQSIPQ
ncbi:MAG: hypothetical protein WB558_04010 [Terriglobales bacterium]